MAEVTGHTGWLLVIHRSWGIGLQAKDCMIQSGQNRCCSPMRTLSAFELARDHAFGFLLVKAEPGEFNPTAPRQPLKVTYRSDHVVHETDFAARVVAFTTDTESFERILRTAEVDDQS